MKKVIVVSVFMALAAIIALGGTVHAQEGDGLSDPGITPDGSLYYAEQFYKQVTLFFTFDGEAKIGKCLRYAEESLAETEAMLSRNMIEEANASIKNYENYLKIATNTMLRNRDYGFESSEKVALAIQTHLEFINKEAGFASSEGQRLAIQLRERARICQETALNYMAQGDAEKAVRTSLRLMEQQLNRIALQVQGRDKNTLGAQLEEYERCFNMFQYMEKNATQVGQELGSIILQQSANQIQQLKKIQENLQQQNQLNLQNTIQNCIQEQQMVTNEVQNRLRNENTQGANSGVEKPSKSGQNNK